MAAKAQERVVILGGGMSALTTAMALSDPEQQGRYDITICQMGWRLGGKGASGRNRDRNARIEEHGLHVWFGFYQNAFRLMAECYAELNRPAGSPLATLDDAFKPQNFYLLRERIGDEWRDWPVTFPQVRGEEGAPDDDLGQMLRILAGWLGMVLGLHTQADTVTPIAPHAGGADGRLHTALGTLLGQLRTRAEYSLAELVKGVEHGIERLLGAVGRATGDVAPRVMVELLDLIAQLAWDQAGARVAAGHDEARRFWVPFYIGVTVARGFLTDDLPRRGLSVIDDEEFTGWLERHSCFADTAAGDPNGTAFRSAPVRAFYDAAFGFAGGDTLRPNIAAGVALRSILKIAFQYEKAILFQMQAGMGDTVFTPLYQVLRRRGVKFQFFTRATALHLTPDKTAISGIDLSRQVTLKTGAYEPLFAVKELDCWPSRPFFEQIVEGEALEASGSNLEHYDSGWSDCGGTQTLVAGQDFDRVVLAIPLPCLTDLCRELIAASDRWQAMMAHVTSCQTLAMQLWFAPDRAGMGLPIDPAIIGAFQEPWSSITDFSHLIAREDWPTAATPGYLTYSCGVVPDTSPSNEMRALEAVFASAKGFLKADAPIIWPGTANLATGAFRFDLLCGDGANPDDRLRGQYLRANVDVSELYVQSTAGTIGYRMKAGESEFANLVLAGDWTDNGLNIGSIEGCALSGLQASRVISGHPHHIPGEKDKLSLW